MMQRDLREENAKIPRIEPEPALTAVQIGELEQKLGAGLIEEVIQVAEGENQLVDTLAENKVYVAPFTRPIWVHFEKLTSSQVGRSRGEPKRGPVGILRARQAHTSHPGTIESQARLIDDARFAKHGMYICTQYQLTCHWQHTPCHSSLSFRLIVGVGK